MPGKKPLQQRQQNKHSHDLINLDQKRETAKRISMSLPTKLLSEFDKSMLNAGYIDRSKALQTAMHSFINDYEWNSERNGFGAGAIIMLYDNHVYDQDEKSTQVQHRYQEIISATTHIHLNESNCLETIIVKGHIKKVKELVKYLSQNRGIKNLKVHFFSLV
ncbi:MAG: CopG family ribbon-helix-helix protein [Candidatus Nitrosocosmicus sp.]